MFCVFKSVVKVQGSLPQVHFVGNKDRRGVLQRQPLGDKTGTDDEDAATRTRSVNTVNCRLQKCQKDDG